MKRWLTAAPVQAQLKTGCVSVRLFSLLLMDQLRMRLHLCLSASDHRCPNVRPSLPSMFCPVEPLCRLPILLSHTHGGWGGGTTPGWHTPYSFSVLYFLVWWTLSLGQEVVPLMDVLHFSAAWELSRWLTWHGTLRVSRPLLGSHLFGPPTLLGWDFPSPLPWWSGSSAMGHDQDLGSWWWSSWGPGRVPSLHAHCHSLVSPALLRRDLGPI